MAEADSTPNPESVRSARQKGFVPDTTKRAKLQSGLFRSTDGGETWTRMESEDSRPFYYSQVRVDPKNADRVYFMWEAIRMSNDGGKTIRTVGQGLHTDNHAMWIDPNDPDHYLVGDDGGVAQTYDRGRTYDALLQMPVGQFYAIGLDMQRPFWVCGGLQDNGSWCGPSESPRGRIMNDDWTNVNGGDGFYAAIDPTNSNTVYTESQGGSIARLDLRTWERRSIRPGTIQTPGGGGGFFGGGTTIGRMLEDSVVLARGDTTVPATPAQQHVLDSLERPHRGRHLDPDPQPLQLVHAVLHLGAQPQHALHGRPAGLEDGGPRRPLVSDQRGPVHPRQREDPDEPGADRRHHAGRDQRGDPRHGRGAGRVAGAAGDPLGGHR